MLPSETKLLDMLEDATKAPHLIKTLACWRSHCKLAFSSELCKSCYRMPVDSAYMSTSLLDPNQLFAL